MALSISTQQAEQFKSDVSELFAMHSRTLGIWNDATDAVQASGEYFTSDAECQQLSAYMAAVSLAADLGSIIRQGISAEQVSPV